MKFANGKMHYNYFPPVQLQRFPLGFLALVFLPGVFCGLNFALWLFAAVFFLAIPGIMLCAIKRSAALSLFILFSAVFAAGLLHGATWRLYSAEWLGPLTELMPREIAGKVVATGPGKNSLIVSDVRISIDQQRLLPPGKILLRLPADSIKSILPGHRVKINETALEPLPGRRNPGDFDYRRYLQSIGICAIVAPRSSARVMVVEPAGAFDWRLMMARFRFRISEIICDAFQAPVAGFLRSLILGDRTDLDRNLKTVFSNTGMMHVLAVSGLHTGFVMVLILILLSFLPGGYVVRNLLAALGLIFYAAVTGAGAPVVRAATLGLLYLLAENCGRPARFLNLIGLAAILQIWWEPALLMRLEFQLSFSAVISIVVLFPKSRRLRRRWLRRLPAAWRRPADHWVLSPLVVSFAAQIGTFPFLISGFGQMPLLGIFLNIVVVPLIGFILLAAFVFLALALIGVRVSALAAVIQEVSTHLFSLVRLAELLPGISLRVQANWIVPVLLCLLAIVLIGIFRKMYLIRFFVPQMVALTILFQLTMPQRLSLLFMDVGQGDAALLRTPHGYRMLIDSGPANPRFDSGDRIILPLLRAQGINRLQAILISHAHRDHSGGAAAVIKSIAVDSLYLPAGAAANTATTALIDICRERRTGVRFLAAGDHIKPDGDSKIYIVSPDSMALHQMGIDNDDLNNYSLVALLHHHRAKVLFAGDAEAPSEYLMQKWQDLLDVDVLKIGHHGSKSSSHGAFLDQLTPQYGVISCGRRNRFGHPDPQVLQRLEQKNIAVLRTDHRGAILLEWTGKSWQDMPWR